MSWELPSEVLDTSGTRYRLGALLGRGGQGAVFEVRGLPLVIKLVTAGTPSARQRVQEQIARVKRLPLDGLEVARPLRSLAPPHVGYVMELMTGMQPLERLIRVPKQDTEDFAPWYLKTGSLLRRLRLLARCGDLFARLHGRGLAYGDGSPNNIFVSEDPDCCEVWLIDCDNVAAGVSRRVVYTPGYAAPELLRGHGSDALTDAWSFATIAFETLCVLHPFEGDLVHDGGAELEEQAHRGQLPWVDAASGANSASRGLPRDMVLTPRLRELAERCFGDSRLERLERPGAAVWAEKLFSAADQTLVCPGCSSSYFLNRPVCPWCDSRRPPFATAEVYFRDRNLKDGARNPFHLVAREHGRPAPCHRIVIQEGREVALTDRVLSGAASGQTRVTATLEDSRLILHGTVECRHRLRHRQGRTLRLADKIEHLDLMTGSSRWWLIPEDESDVHRTLSFTFRPGVSQ